MNTMKVELNEINDGISLLDENERLTLVQNMRFNKLFLILTLRHKQT